MLRGSEVRRGGALNIGHRAVWDKRGKRVLKPGFYVLQFKDNSTITLS